MDTAYRISIKTKSKKQQKLKKEKKNKKKQRALGTIAFPEKQTVPNIQKFIKLPEKCD